ncbi:GA-binding protein subunit beta-1-like [Schistocerca cancellata]|uniref:GA-binding protein subunit beta-1-like n=1 Tax=Schistocerca cancellata TaxID=274614 RepID=UPI0021178D79|nr:GA-binding protein subunit beta-1-like [Schistocerca cancellata]XP_049769805.1 GA-binding protein subunit beta-1-like [Schistocerca cancellata]
MIYRASIWLIYILMAVVRATDFSEPESNTTEYVTEATVDRLRTDEPQSPPTAPPQEVTDTAAVDLEPATETSVPATPESTLAASTLPHSDYGDHSRTPVATAPTTTAHTTPAAGDTTISRLRTLSAEMNSKVLLQAATRGSEEEVQVPLWACANVGQRPWSTWTALHYAAMQGHTGMVRCLIGNRVEVDARSDAGHTPLHLAAWKGHAAVVRLLAAASADVDAKDQWGRTPLHWAAPYGHTEAAKALLEAGADRDATEDAGNTALDLARVNNRNGRNPI